MDRVEDLVEPSHELFRHGLLDHKLPGQPRNAAAAAAAAAHFIYRRRGARRNKTKYHAEACDLGAS